MAEYIGTNLQIDVQKRLRDRQQWIAETPEVAHGGRILNFLNAEKLGWDKVSELTMQDRVAGFTAVPLETTLLALKRIFGAGWKMPYWYVFFGEADFVLKASEQIVDAIVLPIGWHLESVDCPSDPQIDKIQKLNIVNGIAPYPAYYIRGEAVPCTTSMLTDDRGRLVATASANYRYHSESRFKQHLFAGSVAVSKDHRGRGFGKLLNAEVLIESHKRYGWARVLEQAKPDNVPSRAMIEACGLRMDPELVTITVIASDEDFTR